MHLNINKPRRQNVAQEAIFEYVSGTDKIQHSEAATKIKKQIATELTEDTETN